MLKHPTIDKLQALKLTGMAKGLQEQTRLPEIETLGFEERLGLLVDREHTERQNRLLSGRLRRAKLRQQASPENIDLRAQRGLDKSLINKLLTCQWINEHQNIVLTGPTGVGKTYLACALATQAARHGCSVLYYRLPRLLEELAIARADGRYVKVLAQLAKTEVVVLDDWGMHAFTDTNRRDLLELFDDRHNKKSTLVTSQLDVEHWYDNLGDPTLADAILDRLVHNAHRITLRGESLRKQKSLTKKENDLTETA